MQGMIGIYTVRICPHIYYVARRALNQVHLRRSLALNEGSLSYLGIVPVSHGPELLNLEIDLRLLTNI